MALNELSIQRPNQYTFSFNKNMTFIMRQVFTNQVHPIPFSTNKRRTLQFANKLVQLIGPSHHETYIKIENVFESATFGMTYLNNPLTMLKPHIDFFNCHEKGFNNVFGIYFNMEHPKKNYLYGLFYSDIPENQSMITIKD